MTATRRIARYTASAAAIAVLFAGSAVIGKPQAPAEAAALAQQMLGKGKVDKAIEFAEQAVAASPRDPSLRLILAQSYLKGGRFDSAATTYNDAMDLGDNGPRTALALALSNVAAGRRNEAVAILDDWRDSIPATDLGLAYSLAGETARGVAILVDAVRGGENTAKLRQNLAYAYALDGRWAEARTMAAQDVSPDQIDQRISDWAQTARPEDYHRRVATLLSVPLRSDPGQPTRLALNTTPASEQLASEAAATQPAAELAVAAAPAAPVPAPAFAEAAPALAPVAAAPAAVVPVAEPSPAFKAAFADTAPTTFTARPAAQPVRAPASKSARVLAPAVARRADGSVAHAPAAAPVAIATGGTHFVQLGSFSSEQGARRAWGLFTAKNPELRGYRMTITPATVHGRSFWRVAAAGLNQRGASGLCSTVKGRGGVCFAYAATTPPPGAMPEAFGASGPQRARKR